MATRHIVAVSLFAAGAFGLTGCKDLAGTTGLPAGTVDPGTVKNAVGAMGMYRQTVKVFNDAVFSVVRAEGLITDELQARAAFGIGVDQNPATTGVWFVQLDGRLLPEGSTNGVDGLHSIRQSAMQAIGALRKYGEPVTPAALRGEMYALEGYAEIWLADLFCSGVPLSTFDFEQDFTYHAGSTTQQVYEHALALFDTAETLSGDSLRILNFARVGRGRALLALGRYAEAGAAVQDVAPDFRQSTNVAWTSNGTDFLGTCCVMSDREGINGLPYRSSNDPRSAADPVGLDPSNGTTIFFPHKYGHPTDTSAVVIADGIEAQLIMAEAALQANDVSGWLDALNSLRQTAIVPALPALTDPALDPLPAGKTATDVRVDLLFQERAYWLYLTGHRQGDLRRLVRESPYRRLQQNVYPTGRFSGSASYGTDVTIPISSAERANPLFVGCFDRGA